MSTEAAKKVAIITGASTGIGRATATALSAAGWHLALCARRQTELQETAQACTGPEPLVFPGNVTDEAYVRKLFQTVVERFGRLDMVFNNAGIGAPGVPMEDLPLDKFQEVMNVNVCGTFLFTREAMRVFKQQNPQGGRIINNGSISAYTPRPFSCAYTASKHAIAGLTKSTALDGRAFDITCTEIDIGNAETPMTVRMKEGMPQANGSVVPETTFDAKHVADAVVHIASLPNTVQVLTMNIMSTKMPFVGRG